MEDYNLTQKILQNAKNTESYHCRGSVKINEDLYEGTYKFLRVLFVELSMKNSGINATLCTEDSLDRKQTVNTKQRVIQSKRFLNKSKHPKNLKCLRC